MEREPVRFVPKETVLERIENRAPTRIVEVLSPDEYEHAHLPGAINIPLKRLRDEAPERLSRNEEVIVYCASYTCHASTKAARILQQMGYDNVLDYKGGKADWGHAGLPFEGHGEHEEGEDEEGAEEREAVPSRPSA